MQMSHGARSRKGLSGSVPLQRRQPLGAGLAGVELALLLLCGKPYAPLARGVADHGEVPGLVVGAAWRGAGRGQALLDQIARHRLGREVADGASPAHRLVEGTGAGPHLVDRQAAEAGEGDRLVVAGHRLPFAAIGRISRPRIEDVAQVAMDNITKVPYYNQGV